MVNTKCIRYSVDPQLLNAGIPVEDLEKHNIQEFQSGETLQHLNRYAQETRRLCGLKTVEHYPEPPAQLEIELGLSDYNKVLSGRLIKISADIAKYQGEKFKIKSKGTTSYTMRVLLLVGDGYGGKFNGYFQ